MTAGGFGAVRFFLRLRAKEAVGNSMQGARISDQNGELVTVASLTPRPFMLMTSRVDCHLCTVDFKNEKHACSK